MTLLHDCLPHTRADGEGIISPRVYGQTRPIMIVRRQVEVGYHAFSPSK